jgi:hypothetical protein
MSQLGTVLGASWESVGRALAAQNARFRLKASTADFQRTGGMMLTILNAPASVFVVTALVTVRGKPNRHAICVSTVPEQHCPHGKLIDNKSSMRPVYIEACDRVHKPGAKRAFKKLFAQCIGHEDFDVKLAEIFKVVAV